MHRHRHGHHHGSAWDTIKTVFYALLIAGAIRTVVFEPFNIPSASMVPTLLIGDYLFVSKYAYGYSRYSLPWGIGPSSVGRLFERVPQRGDVVVFKKPPENDIDYIKRLIGLPGDRIQVSEGRLYINGQMMERREVNNVVERDREDNIVRAPQYIETLPDGREHRIAESMGDIGPADNTPVYLVPPGHYFMMGDNRDNSQDSRFLSEVGYVPAENLVGRAEITFFSVDTSIAQWWQVWKWPMAIRFGRIMKRIE